MKKKTLSLILASAMVVSLAACGNSNTPADSPAPAPENTPAETTPADNAQESTAENNQEDMSPDNSSEQADAPTDDTVSVEGKLRWLRTLERLMTNLLIRQRGKE